MSAVTWVLERDVFSEECFSNMVDHFKKKNIPYHIVRIVPFIHEIEGKVPEISGPVIVYGSLGIHKLAKKHGWKPGVWSNDRFNESILIKALGQNALNHDIITCKFEDVMKTSPWETFFVKPNTDTKEFAGMVTTKEEFNEWYMKMMTSGYFFEGIEQKEVVIGSPKNIGCEWRLVILNGKVIEYSIYRQYQKVMPAHECPQEVINFAEDMSKIYSPAPVFVMDICEAENGYKVIEANGFNSAGLYKCDVSVIIDEINGWLENASS